MCIRDRIYSDELLAVAKRIFCFGTPEEALEFPIPRRKIPGVDPATIPDFFPSKS